MEITLSYTETTQDLDSVSGSLSAQQQFPDKNTYSTQCLQKNAQGKLASVWFCRKEGIKSNSEFLPTFVPLEFFLHSLRSSTGDNFGFFYFVFLLLYTQRSLQQRNTKKMGETIDILKWAAHGRAKGR